MKNHRWKRPDSGKIASPLNAIFSGVKNECRICPILPVKSSKYEDVRWGNLVAHGQITWNPFISLWKVYLFPYFLFNIEQFTNICDLFGIKFDSSWKYVDVSTRENTACCWVSCNVEISDSMPLVLVDIIVLAISVEVLSVVSTNSVDPIHIPVVNCCEIAPGVVEKSSVL